MIAWGMGKVTWGRLGREVIRRPQAHLPGASNMGALRMAFAPSSGGPAYHGDLRAHRPEHQQQVDEVEDVDGAVLVHILRLAAGSGR